MIEASKKRMDEEFGQWLYEKYKEDKRLYGKDVTNKREENIINNEETEVMDGDGIC